MCVYVPSKKRRQKTEKKKKKRKRKEKKRNTEKRYQCRCLLSWPFSQLPSFPSVPVLFAVTVLRYLKHCTIQSPRYVKILRGLSLRLLYVSVQRPDIAAGRRFSVDQPLESFIHPSSNVFNGGSSNKTFVRFPCF